MARNTEPANLGPAELKIQTDKAILVVLEADEEEHWIPRSVLSDENECTELGESGDLWVASWFADKEGLR
jgi:hypothetical protein